MTKKGFLSFNYFLLVFLLGITITNAQKLPNKQEASVWAPANIKIDGKATEWDNTFQAYNHATDVFYTISNDDKNLYLTIQATNDEALNKILGKGLTLTIQRLDKKNAKSKMSITYPLYDKGHSPIFTLHNKKLSSNDTSLKDADIVMHNANARLNGEKWIGITGISGLDSLISVYNEDNVNAAQRFNNQKAYTLELAIALKYLQPCISNAKFAYNIRLNGLNYVIETFEAPLGSAPQTIAMFEKMNTTGSLRAATLGSPTDFSGEYTLAKKP